MSVTQIDIDEEASERVMALAGVRTTKDAVNLALRFYAEQQERAARRGRHFERAQRRTALTGRHRSASAVDLLIAATAAHHGLTVLHDAADHRTVARHAPDLGEHSILDHA
ncbi:type II toxin-antitoxin system VapB family antitoxin [Streptomyces sp. BE20]|uniref:type II toxin-antitoxin system VapB family antitoxin n=1 Tax=Streptomyces sp. BE20 TaxID=3002525 RepID=UPI002E77DBEF|nr:type II toxin-antitoxin system VapB family antitoxin [Streptomyces sp. BE20]MEE1825721.1 type II toxin-antitoxin system VapB family antitoxin [Streptomyces sp. BE20]